MNQGSLHLLGFEDWLEVRDKAKLIPNPARLLVEHAQGDEARRLLLEASGCESLETALLPVSMQAVQVGVHERGAALMKDFNTFRGALDPALERVKPGDLVVAMGQYLPVSDTRIRIETRFPGVFSVGGKDIHDFGEARNLDAVLHDQLATSIQAGNLPGFVLSKDAGRFFCNALGNLLDGKFFLHLSGLNDPSEYEAYWGRYSASMIKSGLIPAREALGHASVTSNFENLCTFLSVVRSFESK